MPGAKHSTLPCGLWNQLIVRQVYGLGQPLRPTRALLGCPISLARSPLRRGFFYARPTPRSTRRRRFEKCLAHLIQCETEPSPLRFKIGVMQWRHQVGALLCALVLLTILFAIGVRSLAPVRAGNSMRPSPTSISSQAKATFNPATSLEIDIPSLGSFETPWDAGALWDDEAPAYELLPGD